MIKFFRRIRQRLLTENKFSKYLLYAIGEIVLVVIGILIALTINNWNEIRKEKELETQILIQLQKDISDNIESLEYILNEHIKSKNATISLLMIYADTDKVLNVKQIDSLVELSTAPKIFNPKIGFFKSVISTGEIKLIKNQDIITFITSIEEEIENATSNYKRLIESWDDNLFIRQHRYVRWMSIAAKDAAWFQFQFPKSLFDTDYKGFFDDAILENMYMITVYDQTQAVLEEQTLLESMKHTLTLINEELGNPKE